MERIPYTSYEVCFVSSNVDEMRSAVDQFKSSIDEAKVSVFQMNRALSLYFGLARRFGLPEPINEAIIKLQQYRIIVMMVRRSLMLLYTASGPIGWLMALGTVTVTGLMVADQMELTRPVY